MLALLLDHQDLFQPLGELADAVGLERPGHADLHHPQADLGRELLVDAQIVQRLAHVEIGLAGGDDPQPRARAVDDDPVEPVGAGVGERGVGLVLLHPRFLHQRRVRPADRQAARRHDEVAGACTISTRCGSTSTTAVLSTVSVTALKATQQPE